MSDVVKEAIDGLIYDSGVSVSEGPKGTRTCDQQVPAEQE